MLLLHIKFTAIIIFIAIGFKFVTNRIAFNMSDYCIKDIVKSGVLSLIIIAIQLIITTIYLLIIKKYFMNVSTKGVLFSIVIVFLLQLFLVLTIVILMEESISSVGITKDNIIKSIIIGIMIGVLYYVLVIHTFKVNKIMDIISIGSCNSFIYFLIIGFGEEIIYRGYLQIRLISWLGTIKGYFLTAMIFSFIHIPQRLIMEGMSLNSTLMNCALLIPISLLLGYISIKTRSIFASSIFHAFIDWTQTVVNIVV